MESNWKPSATKRKIEKKDRVAKATKHEADQKREVRKRDGYKCRFPLCGCRRIGLKLEARGEVSHQQHKGMGGDPLGIRTQAALMIYLCKHRHQDGAVSIHKGTLRAVYLTPAKANGPVAWEVDVSVISTRSNLQGPRWKEVARETSVQRLAPITEWQRDMLAALGEMEL